MAAILLLKEEEVCSKINYKGNISVITCKGEILKKTWNLQGYLFV